MPIPKDWSPDGKQLLCVFRRWDGSHQLALVSVADGTARVLKSLEWRYPGSPRFSPDGHYIVYELPVEDKGSNSDIYLLASDGCREIPLVQHPAADYSPEWTPDGSKVVFVSERTGASGLWAIGMAGGKPRGSPELLTKHVGGGLLGFTRKGSLYYTSATASRDVYVAGVDLKSGRVTTSPSKVERFEGSNSSPAWSPGGQLAYVSRRGSGPVVVLSGSSQQEREIAVPAMQGLGQIRRCGERTLVASGYGSKQAGVFRIDASSGEVSGIATQKFLAAQQHHAVCSPGGQSIGYSPGSPADRIVARDVATGEEKMLYRTAGGALVRSLALSPDGGRIVVAVAESLLLVPAVGGEPRELMRVPKPGGIDAVAWTPDGSQVLFGRHRDVSKPEQGDVELWHIAAEGGQPRSLGLAMEAIADLAVHPDGRQIAFAAGKRVNEVWVMENLLSAPPVTRAAGSTQ